MIYERRARLYCSEDLSLIENYDKAIADTTQTWHCHHKDEIRTLPSGMVAYRSQQELKENGRYYNCPANELIFLTREEHNPIHRGNPVLKSKELHERQAKGNTGNTRSEFGKLFKDTYGINMIDNTKLYRRERAYYNRHNKLKGVK